jgi:hypothetical protein
MHGDGVPVTGIGKSSSMSLEILTWMSLLAVGTTLETNFYIYSVFKDLVVETPEVDTYDSLWKKLRWSFAALWEGRWPHLDAEGNRIHGPNAHRAGDYLADGFFGVLYVLRGDLEWAWERLKLCNYRAVAAGPCCFCPCNGHDLPWSDFRITAPRAEWMNRVHTALEWHASHVEKIPIFSLPGLSVLTFYGDLMHTKHLGTDAWFFGSVLWMLTYLILPDTASHNMNVVWDHIHAWYKAHPAQRSVFSALRLSMFTVPEDPTASYPCLKGQASSIRHLGPALLSAWREFADMSDMLHKQIELALTFSVDMEHIVDQHVDCATLPPDSAERFHAAVFDFLACYTFIAKHFVEVPVGRRRKLFNVTVKFHYLAHIGLLAWALNPRYGWCYSGEDMMQKTKRLAHSCLRGLGTDAAPSKMLVKYMFGMHLLMIDGQHKLR